MLSLRHAVPLSLLVIPAVTSRAQSAVTSLQIPQQIQYQGRVAQNGTAWNGEGFFVFALVENGTVLWNNWQGTYDPATGTLTDPGSAVLADKFTTASVAVGSFSVRLGSDPAANNKPVLPTAFFNAQTNSVRPSVKLAVWFSADSQTFTRLSPDVSLASVPYAMVAGIAETVPDRAVGNRQIAAAAVSTDKLAASAVETSELADGAVTSAKVANGEIRLEDLASDAVDSLRIVNGQIATVDLADGAVTPVKNAPECAVYFKEVDQNTAEVGTVTGWQVRSLNGGTQTGSSISRVGNTITLQPGTYLVNAEAVAYSVGSHQLAFRDVTNGSAGVPTSTTAVIRGITTWNNTSPSYSTSTSNLTGIVTVTGSAGSYELWNYISTVSGNPYTFGRPTGGAGVDSRYAQISIIRLR